MTRRGGVIRAFVQANKAAERAAREEARRQQALVREAERVQRGHERAQVANQKELARLHVESRLTDVAVKNSELQETILRLKSLLGETLNIDCFLDFETMKVPFDNLPFDPGDLAVEERAPLLEEYLPLSLPLIQRLLPGASKRREEEVARSQANWVGLLLAGLGGGWLLARLAPDSHRHCVGLLSRLSSMVNYNT